jgi:hypothetical protein
MELSDHNKVANLIAQKDGYNIIAKHLKENALREYTLKRQDSLRRKIVNAKK